MSGLWSKGVDRSKGTQLRHEDLHVFETKFGDKLFLSRYDFDYESIIKYLFNFNMTIKINNVRNYIGKIENEKIWTGEAKYKYLIDHDHVIEFPNHEDFCKETRLPHIIINEYDYITLLEYLVSKIRKTKHHIYGKSIQLYLTKDISHWERLVEQFNNRFMCIYNQVITFEFNYKNFSDYVKIREFIINS